MTRLAAVWGPARLRSVSRVVLPGAAGATLQFSQGWNLSVTVASLGVAVWTAGAQQVIGVDAELFCQAFDDLHTHVALAAFDGADVGAVVSQLLGQLLLAQTSALSKFAYPCAELALQVSGHRSSLGSRY